MSYTLARILLRGLLCRCGCEVTPSNGPLGHISSIGSYLAFISSCNGHLFVHFCPMDINISPPFCATKGIASLSVKLPLG